MDCLFNEISGLVVNFEVYEVYGKWDMFSAFAANKIQINA